MDYLAELGEQPAGMPYAGYREVRNMDMQNMDVEIGYPVARNLPGRGEIEASSLPGGPVASVTHIGPYNQLGAAYEALAAWTHEQGCGTTNTAYELYYNSPLTTPPEQLRTEVFLPLTSGKATRSAPVFPRRKSTEPFDR